MEAAFVRLSGATPHISTTSKVELDDDAVAFSSLSLGQHSQHSLAIHHHHHISLIIIILLLLSLPLRQIGERSSSR
jgi:hypothetical protein